MDSLHRKQYKQKFNKENYVQRTAFHVKKRGRFPTIYNRFVVLNPSDKLFYPAGCKMYFSCPARNIDGILIPRLLLVLTKIRIRKDSDNIPPSKYNG